MVVVFLMPTCSTIDQEAVRKVDKAAVAIVGINKQLNYGPNFNIGQLVQRLAEDEKFDITPLSNKLRKRTYGRYAELFPFKLIPEEKVIQSDKYQNFQLFEKTSKEQNIKQASQYSHFITPDNYLKYYPRLLNNREKRSRLFDAVPDEAEGIVMMSISYKLKQEMSPMPGVKKGKVEAKLRMDLIKENGERIFKVNKTGKSNNQVKVVLNTGVLKAEKIRPLCVEATNQVMAKAQSFLQKKMAS